jgi:hypothetical protein
MASLAISIQRVGFPWRQKLPEGAPGRVADDAKVFSHRKSPFILNIYTRWRDAGDDEKCMNWARDFHSATRPFSDGIYVNFIKDKNKNRAKDAYTPQVWDRLVVAKRRWDTDNLFRMNMHINPNGG